MPHPLIQSGLASPLFMIRQLVRDLMTVGVETCSLDTPIDDLASALLANSGEDIVVMDDGHALGTIGLEQLMQAYSKGDYPALKARDILHEGVPQIPPDIPLAAAAQIMLDRKVKTLFLMHNAAGVTYPAAMISYRHFLRHISAQREEDLNDLGIHADRKSPVEAFLERRNAARRQNKFSEE